LQSKITISARDLGKIRLLDFCPRCFWFTYNFPILDPHPFRSPLPGIISILDAYIKQVVNLTFSTKKQLPKWLTQILNELKVIEILQPRKWQVKIENFILTGVPDAIWKIEDDSIFIADYKVAQLTQAQDALFPLYETQLKAYAYLAQKNGYKVSRLALIYIQPQRYREEPQRLLNITADQFALYFNCNVKFIESWESKEIEDMVCELGNILAQTSPPASKENCKGCVSLKEWFDNMKNLI